MNRPYLLAEDDPIVRSMIKTGLPPWLLNRPSEDDEDWEDDGDVYYGNESEEY